MRYLFDMEITPKKRGEKGWGGGGGQKKKKKKEGKESRKRVAIRIFSRNAPEDTARHRAQFPRFSLVSSCSAWPISAKREEKTSRPTNDDDDGTRCVLFRPISSPSGTNEKEPSRGSAIRVRVRRHRRRKLRRCSLMLTGSRVFGTPNIPPNRKNCDRSIVILAETPCPRSVVESVDMT